MYSEKVMGVLKKFRDHKICVIDTMAVNYEISDNVTIISSHSMSNEKLFNFLKDFKDGVVVFDDMSHWLNDWSMSGNFQTKYRTVFGKLSELAKENNLLIFT